MDVHNTCLVVAILSLTVSAMVIWSSFMGQGDKDNTSRHEVDIKVILSDLHTSHRQSPDKADDEATLRFLSSNHLWQRSHMSLHNYFMGGYFLHRDKYHQRYTHSYLSILPFFHDPGGHFERCLRSTAFTHNHAVSPRMTIWNRVKWDMSSQGVFKFKHKFKVHYGEASFGACRNSQRSHHDGLDATYHPSESEESGHKHRGSSAAGDMSRCGHAFIMQDPLTLAIADLAECFLDPRSKQICQLVHQRKTTVEEWVAARGNIVLKNILFHSDMCQNMTPNLNSQQQRHSQFNSSGGISPHELCEINHAKFVDNLQPNTIDRLVKFIVENIQNWFSVVGIFEDFTNSLTMLNHVFRFPLHECEFVSRFRDTTLNINPHLNIRTFNKIQNNSLNKFNPHWFESSQYKNMPSIPETAEESSDVLSLLEAFSHIDNYLVWGKNIPNETFSGRNKNHQTLSTLSDYSVIDRTNKVDQINFHSKVDDKNQNTLSFDPNKNPQIQNMSAGSELYFKDLSNKNGSKQSESNVVEKVDDALRDIISEKTIMMRANKVTTDAAVTRLYKRFGKSLAIRQSLAADLQIYEAVKRLYVAQKQLFFNSIKPV